MTEIREQYETALRIDRVNFRNLDTGVAQQARHLDERSDVLSRRRSIHDNPAFSRAMHPKVAAETGIRGGGYDTFGRISQIGMQPIKQLGVTSVR